MIKAITFDLDGVYFTQNSIDAFIQNFPKKITDPDRMVYVLAKSDEMSKFKKGIISEVDYWSYVQQEFDTKISLEEISQLFMDSYQVNPNVVEIVKKVRKLGIKTCICTNNYPTRINALNKKFNFLNNFDVQVFSYQVATMKPDIEIFQSLVEKSGCQPNEIIFADDKQSNVDAALSLDINAFLYTNFPDFLEKLLILGVNL
ncbi:MAG: HAD family phosphatase [Candidatus Shapirobacteria bacterium]